MKRRPSPREPGRALALRAAAAVTVGLAAAALAGSCEHGFRASAGRDGERERAASWAAQEASAENPRPADDPPGGAAQGAASLQAEPDPGAHDGPLAIVWPAGGGGPATAPSAASVDGGPDADLLAMAQQYVDGGVPLLDAPSGGGDADLPGTLAEREQRARGIFADADPIGAGTGATGVTAGAAGSTGIGAGTWGATGTGAGAYGATGVTAGAYGATGTGAGASGSTGVHAGSTGSTGIGGGGSGSTGIGGGQASDRSTSGAVMRSAGVWVTPGTGAGAWGATGVTGGASGSTGIGASPASGGASGVPALGGGGASTPAPAATSPAR